MASFKVYTEHDYEGVSSLLKECGYQNIPPHDEIKNLSITAVESGEIVGFVWCCHNGYSAYIDYLAVHPAHRKDKVLNSQTTIPVFLMLTLLRILNKIGVKKFYGFNQPTPSGEHLAKTFAYLGTEFREAKYVCVAEVDGIVKKVERILYEQFNNSEN